MPKGRLAARAWLRCAISVAAMSGAVITRAADNSWIGPATGSWTGAANWSNGVPQSGDAVFIDAGRATNTTVTLDTNSSVSTLSISAGDQLSLLAGGSLAVSGSAATNASTLSIASSSRLIFAGSLNNSSNINLAGTLLAPSGSLTLDGNGTVNLQFGQIQGAGRLVNQNNVIQGVGGIGVFSPGMLNMGTVRSSGNNLVLTIFSSTATPPVNAGIFEAGTFSILTLTGQLGKIFDNTSGIIQAQGATLVQLDNGATIVGGVLRSFLGGQFIVQGGGTKGSIQDVQNQGEFEVYNSGSLTVTGTIQNTGNFYIQSNPLPTYILMGGGTTTFTGNGHFTMYVDARIGGSGTFDNQGNTITGRVVGGSGTTSAGTVGDNSIAIINRASGVIETSAATLAVDPNAGGLANFGTLRSRDGGLLRLLNNGPGTFSNSGTVDATGAGSIVRVEDPATLTNASATALVGGVWSASGGGRIEIGSATFTNNQATVLLDGAASTFPAINPLAQNNGSFSIKGSKDFTTSGALSNNAMLTIGTGSDLAVAGLFTQASSATLDMILGGTGAESFGQLSAGTVNLDGTLQIELASGYFPGGISTYTLISAGSVNGTFSSLTAPPLSGRTYELLYSPTTVVLRVVPEPLATGILILAAIAPTLRRIPRQSP